MNPKSQEAVAGFKEEKQGGERTGIHLDRVPDACPAASFSVPAVTTYGVGDDGEFKYRENWSGV
jgi:hypothetical protein